MSRSVYFCVLACFAVGLFTKGTQADSCWSSWSNTMQPSDANNRTDREKTPSIDHTLNTKCSSKYGVECHDNGGEPITGSRNMTTSHYVVSCNMTSGLDCTPYPNFKANNYTCPDFSIRIGCDCPTTPAKTTTTIATTKVPAGNGGGRSTTGLNGSRNSGPEKARNTILYFVIALAALFPRH